MIDIAAIVLLAPLCVLALFVLLEAMAALAPVGAAAVDGSTRPRCVVLIPAHNEARGIAGTLASLRPELHPGDRVLVVADNCSDATAAVARDAGFGAALHVLERTDPVARGKGHALNAGLAWLSGSGIHEREQIEVVVFLDADCRFLPGTMAPLVRAAASGRRPVQACNLVEPPKDPSLKDRLSAFAFLFKNLVRPLGLSRLGLPCLLMGTGMAMPWSIASEVKASDALTEDIRLGIDLAGRGMPPRYVPTSHVRSAAPIGKGAATTQRTRWEHGHVQSILRHAPVMILKGVVGLRPSLLFLGLDLAVPPLSLFVLVALTAAAGVATLYWAGAVSLGPLYVGLGALAAIGAAVFLGWVGHGRRLVSLAQLAAVPFYIAWKIPIYLRLVKRPEQQWVRTEREA